MKKHLYYTILAFFVATGIITLMGITGGLTINDKYLAPLVTSFLIELAGAVYGLFRKTDFFSESEATAKTAVISTPSSPVFSESEGTAAAATISTPFLPTLSASKTPSITNITGAGLDQPSSILNQYVVDPQMLNKYLTEQQKTAPIFDSGKEDIINKFTGVGIQWKATVFDVVKENDGTAVLWLNAGEFLLQSEKLQVNLFPELRILRRSDPVIVSAKIRQHGGGPVIEIMGTTLQPCPK